MAKKDKSNNKEESKTNDGSKPITKDERFKSVHNDPRFKLPNLNKLKVKVDQRFSKDELKKLSGKVSGKNAKIDRYGRKINKKDNNLDKFYEHEEDNHDQDKSGISDEESEEESDEERGEESEEEDNIELLAAKVRKEESIPDRARGEGLVSSSSESEESDDSSSSDSEEEAELEEESEIEIEDEKPDETDPTNGFAVVNMDWDNIRAVDLMATFISFVPKGGSITSVTIYPSEFGKERMQKEELEGPPTDLFKSKSKKNDESDSESDLDSDVDINDTENIQKITKKLYTEDDGREDYDSKALRRYQLQRLRYFYAVVKCDSINTARNIYQNCDGTEYESTANIFDLRYVPEDMDFDDDEAKDKCTKIPSTYRPDSKFVTDALQHSKVKLTWDETPKERLTLSSRPLSQKEIEENDFKAYLASDSDESDNNDNNNLKEKYQNLLGDTFDKSNKDADLEDDVDMEITFDPGLKDNNDGDSPKEEQTESTIDEYRRKEKERRQRRMAKFKETKRLEKENSIDVDHKNSKLNAKAKGKGSSKYNNSEADEKKKAELELLMLDQQGNDNEHFSMKDVIKSEKLKRNKKNKGKNKSHDDTNTTQNDFEINLKDPRFKEIFESHEYAIDPTSSEFKKTETMKKILSERAERAKSNIKGDATYKKGKNKKRKTDGAAVNVDNLVNNLKKKHKTK